MSEQSDGQLYYDKGHPGLAAAFLSGYGDGTYDVYAYYNDDDAIAKIEIILISDGKDDEHLQEQ